MAQCSACDEDITGTTEFTCSYCGGSFCPKHHLPESHDCHTVLLTPPTSDGRTGRQPDSHPTPDAKPAQAQTDAVPADETSPGGKRHRDWEPDSASPDLAPDGSLDTDTKTNQDITPRADYARALAIAVAVALLAGIVIVYL